MGTTTGQGGAPALSGWQHCPYCAATLTAGAESLECTSCGARHYAHTYATANVIVLAEQHLLVVRRAREPQAGTLDVPGGFVEETDATPAHAAARELAEEVGVRVGPDTLRIVAAFPEPYRGPDGRTRPTLSLFFTVNLSRRVPLVALDDVAGAAWVPVANVDVDTFGFDCVRSAVTQVINA